MKVENKGAGGEGWLFKVLQGFFAFVCMFFFNSQNKINEQVVDTLNKIQISNAAKDRDYAYLVEIIKELKAENREQNKSIEELKEANRRNR